MAALIALTTTTSSSRHHSLTTVTIFDIDQYELVPARKRFHQNIFAGKNFRLSDGGVRR
jgi:hypothetical protein